MGAAVFICPGIGYHCVPNYRQPGTQKMTISFADFPKVGVRAGTVLRAGPYPEARKPAIKLWIDFGP